MTYTIIYADPPWSILKGGKRSVRPKQSNRLLDYPTLDLPQIQGILAQFKGLANPEHCLFLWTIDKYLHQAEVMAKELDYRLHARIVWNKTNGVAPAFTVRYAHEYLLWLYHDSFPPIEQGQRGKFTTVITEPSRRHSQKPVAAYELIEALYPDAKKLELFARSERPRWDHWGNEMQDSIHLPSNT